MWKRKKADEFTEFVPAGHYFSCLPTRSEIEKFRNFDWSPKQIRGIDLQGDEQRNLLSAFKPYYDTIPFSAARKTGLRYFYENNAFTYSDAIFLHCFIRHFQPRRIIEVGSGYSSCATLDTNELFMAESVRCTFIEPYPALLRSLLKPEDMTRIEILAAPVQEVPVSVFQTLEANDILFIDSTHVTKLGSDVNWLVFEVLPQLKQGVLIHFHDIYYPFAYPLPWLLEGRAWNETYLIRAFLQYNPAFKIRFFASYMVKTHSDWISGNMPDCLKNAGGSLWIEKKE
jgi:hypothetical protein